MNSEQYNRAVEVFQEALSLPERGQLEFVRSACGDDEVVLLRVLQMLQEDRQDNGLFSSRAVEHAAGELAAAFGESPNGDEMVTTGATGDPNDAGAAIPSQIGPYRVIRKVAEGGMGAVYEAEQAQPKRTVALKVIRPGLMSEQIMRRFVQEAEVLGRLQHPGIAQIYEASLAHTEGKAQQPYFAMEYVQGLPLTRYATENNLDKRHRLQLMLSVCGAVHHAHTLGVIHRDIKPDNILVTSDGRPKILDFGIARATDSDLQATTLQTHAGQILGTLAYMSPEQALGKSEAVDARADVYALGATCYQLLTGRLPHDLTGCSIIEAVRNIVEDVATRPATIDRDLRGDVETIVLKAISKEPDRRYASAAELAADISRYLNREPIMARPPTTLYQLTRFAQRNKALAAGILIAFAALLIGTGAASYGLVQAQGQRDEAEQQARIATAVNQFLTEDLLAAVRPDEQGIDVSMRQLLATASESIDERFGDQPVVEAAVRATLGQTYLELGEYSLAEPHLERALKLRRAHLDPDDIGTIDSLMNLGLMYKLWGRYELAERHLREGLDLRRGLGGAEDEGLLKAMNNLAACLDMQGETDEATTIYNETLDLCERLLGPEHIGTLTVMSNLAVVYNKNGPSEDAAKLQERVLETMLRTLGENHSQTLHNRKNLAISYMMLERYEESEEHFLQAEAGHRTVLGENHPVTIWTDHFRPRLYQRQGRFEEAVQLMQSVVQKADEFLPSDHYHRGFILAKYGTILRDAGRPDEAEHALVTAANHLIDVLGQEHPGTQRTLMELADFLEQMDRPDEAASWRAKLPAGADGA